MDLGWTKYEELMEKAYYGACLEHRLKNGLSVENILDIDCATQCEARSTCPIGTVAE